MFCFVVFQIGNRHAPAVIRVTLKAAHFGAELQMEVIFFLQGANQLTRDFAVVNVGADFSTRCCNLLVWVAPFHDQRCPLFDLSMIFRELHATEQAALLQSGVTCAQEVHVLVAPHKAHVRHGVNK
ncbi:hypothetical protein D3C80_1362910 [compost metagenome]